MPRIDQRRESVPGIGDLREIVLVCTTVERPDDNVSTIVERPGVIRVHARVRPLEATQMLDYQAVWPATAGGQLKPPSHEITIRTPPDVKIDLNHWVFHADRYAETWYRVRMVKDMGGVRRFTIMLCSPETTRDRRSDPATQESPPVFEVPEWRGPNAMDRI